MRILVRGVGVGSEVNIGSGKLISFQVADLFRKLERHVPEIKPLVVHSSYANISHMKKVLNRSSLSPCRDSVEPMCQQCKRSNEPHSCSMDLDVIFCQDCPAVTLRWRQPFQRWIPFVGQAGGEVKVESAFISQAARESGSIPR